jgi:tRNA pseudouridine38-40 synthase
LSNPDDSKFNKKRQRNGNDEGGRRNKKASVGGEGRPKQPTEYRASRNGRKPWGENPFSAEEIAAEERRPKRKVAVMLGYSGTGYKGLQINKATKTVEGDVMKAFIAAGAISKANADDPQKVSLVRCARTDKGVHAAGNVLSLKMIVEDDDIVDKINAALPPQIRIWGIQRTNNNFSCYEAVDSRWYEYLLPTHSLIPPHPDSFIGSTILQCGKEKGVLETIQERNRDCEGFWERVDEEVVRPLLAKLAPETRAVVMDRLRSSIELGDDEKLVRAKSREIVQQNAPETVDVQAQKTVQSTEEDAGVAKEAADAAEDAESAARPLTETEIAVRDVKHAIIDARRKYRVSPERLARLQEALNQFVGTNNFHNYTIQKSFKDSSVKRHIKSFEINPSPIVINDTEWVSLKVHGQSFMMHQIRKMVSMATLLVRCGGDTSLIKQTYGPQRIAIPKAPALGLLLETPVFSSYNTKAANMFEKKPIDFENYRDKIEAFKREFIYSRIFEDEERQHV